MNFKKFGYIAAIGAFGFLAYAVHDTRTAKEFGEAGSLTGFVSRPPAANQYWVPNESVTGNILAAGFAQSQRDWTEANLYLDKLNNAMADDPATALRMMLLAVSAGQFDKATEYAQRIKATNIKEIDDTPGTEAAAADGRDLASLVLVAQAIRAGDLSKAETDLAGVQSIALKAFVQPVIAGWVRAAQKKPIEKTTQGLSLLQALHRGLAAEWAGQKDVADQVFDTLARASLAPAGTMMVVGYDIRNGRIDAARAALSESLRNNPMDIDAKAMLDTLSQGQTPAMKPELSYHLKGVSAGVAMAFRDLAQMMQADNASESALIFAQIGRLIRPDVPGLSILVGNVFLEQNRYEDAAAALLSVQPSDSDYVDAQIKLSEIRATENRKDESTAILESLMASNPSPRVAYALGEMYRADKEFKKAVSAFDQAINDAGGKPDDDLWSVYFVRAMALDELGEQDKAEADLKKALEYRPDNPHVLNYLAYSWADRNVNLPKAREMLVKALAAAPSDPYITDSLGWVFFKQGDFAQAVVLLERAVSLKPYDAVLNDHLGDVYEKTGRLLEARYQWARALDYADADKDAKLIADVKAKLASR